jgi:hypothetical protein
VDGITGREDQKRSRDTDIADRERAYELAKPTIERWQEMPNREAYVQSMIASAAYVAYRAGREDLLRSGSCPECAAGDPHNEPDKPHIHLTAYGYLLYAPDHDQLDFVRQIREIERRAGYAEAVARLRDDERYRNWWTAHPDRQFGTAYWAPDGRQHLADYLETVGPDGPDVRTKPVDQSGVQPTEEQRAHE